MYARIFTAVLAVFMLLSILGCASDWFYRQPEYDAATRDGNQCRNECGMSCDSETCMNTCYANCYRYHGGTYVKGPYCILFGSEPVSKDPPKDKGTSSLSEPWPGAQVFDVSYQQAPQGRE